MKISTAKFRMHIAAVFGLVAACGNPQPEAKPVEAAAVASDDQEFSIEPSKPAAIKIAKKPTEMPKPETAPQDTKTELQAPQVAIAAPETIEVVLEGAPKDVFSQEKASVKVTAANLFTYEYEIIEGTKNCESDSKHESKKGEAPIEIDLTSQPDGPFKLCVWGLTESGVKQATATEATWTKKTLSCEGKANGTTETRQVFQNAQVGFNASCVAETQNRKCSDGKWTNWEGSAFTALQCKAAQAAACGSFAHDAVESKEVFQSSTVPYGSSCVKGLQTRRCNNGQFGQWQGQTSYAHTYCRVASAPVPAPQPQPQRTTGIWVQDLSGRDKSQFVGGVFNVNPECANAANGAICRSLGTVCTLFTGITFRCE